MPFQCTPLSSSTHREENADRCLPALEKRNIPTSQRKPMLQRGLWDVFFASGETKHTPMVSIFSLWIPPPPGLSLRLGTSPSLSKITCQLVAASTQGSGALIRYCKPVYRCQAIHVSFLWFPSAQGGAQMRKDGQFPTTNNRRHERTHTRSAAHLETSALLTVAPSPTPNEPKPKKALLTS